MKHPLITPFLLVSMGLFLTGCGTPSSRIKQNPTLFNSFSPEVQARVQQGEVAIGFTKDMAFIALDKPDRTYSRQTADGAVEVWSYVNEEIRYEQQQARATVYVNDVNGQRTRPVNQDVWVNAQNRREYEVLRLEFSDEGTITAIEKLDR
ncbi:MAG: hypothetical protein ACI9TH_000514 [Kiritimatiellia bacterium]|jgi:hypothetical protein